MALKVYCFLLFFNFAHCWRQWNYSVNYGGSYGLWDEQWSHATSSDIGRAPRPRRGHSLVLAGDLLIMFGGRGNEALKEHIPRTYDVKRVCCVCGINTCFMKYCLHAFIGERYNRVYDLRRKTCTSVS